MHVTKNLRKDLHSLIANAGVVDISKRRPATAPASATLDPRQQSLHMRNQLLAYHSTVRNIQTNVARTLANQMDARCARVSHAALPLDRADAEWLSAGQVNVAPELVDQSALGSDQSASRNISLKLQPYHIRSIHYQLLS